MIRNYQPTDIDCVVSVWRKASELAHPFLTREFLDTEADAVRNIYPQYAEIRVTLVDNQVVGFIAMLEDEIGGLFLDPQYHGIGLGRAMIKDAVSQRATINVEVFEKNAIGRRFYEKCGFIFEKEAFHEASNQPTLRLSLKPA
ncbi:MAG: GNAT family N-acetyltransferase [Cohaesibacteraceae bacterium]|nr:GNAT family N-acetyltransferase [Cohaesibacteraceae bacterium]MBL4875064.1 GNAT family N-acetyltransferase [Cohaesibacteraceae bacterium]